jgi:hypothetical protein
VVFNVLAAGRLKAPETVEAFAVAEPKIGERKIDKAHVKATAKVRIAEGKWRFMCSHYRWPLFRAIQERHIITSITGTRNHQSGADVHNPTGELANGEFEIAAI